MSLMKRMLSSIGIGNTKVDTILEQNRFAPGETIEGYVNIKGGKVEQTIDEIYFSVHCSYLVEEEEEGAIRYDRRVAVLDQFQLGQSLTVSAGEEVNLPLSFPLVNDAPLSLGQTQVWIQTGLDIKRAVDPADRDYIEVVCDELLAGFFEAIEGLGFELYEAECKSVRPSYTNRLPFLQEFEWKPTSGPFYGRLDELEMVLAHRGEYLDVWLEIDRKARGFSGFMSEMMGTDETQIHLQVHYDQLPGLAQSLHDLIQQYC